MPSCFAAVTSGSSSSGNPLALPFARRAIVVLIDGLGSSSLAARSGHARTLAGAQGAKNVIHSGFPTTTAAALATLTTGVLPGEHGLVGYSVLDRAHDRVVNQLTGWDDKLDPATWQRSQTIFQRAVAAGVQATVVGHPRYANSGFTHAVLRGADYRAGATIDDRFEVAADWLRESAEPGLLYLYVPELDVAAHASGWESPHWTTQLENVDAAVRSLTGGLSGHHGVLVTADHGMIDVAARNHVVFDDDPQLIDGIRHIAGDPRCLHLHFEPDASELQRARALDAWRASESTRSWVFTRAELIASGWLGAVDPAVEGRIGDVIVAARKGIAYYDGRTATAHSRAMIGQHGSFSADELRVPLLRFGAFAS